MQSVGALAGRRFVGRQREMAVLQPALREASAAHGRLVLLVGEPGIGKTRTAAEFGAAAGQAGAGVQAAHEAGELIAASEGAKAAADYPGEATVRRALDRIGAAHAELGRHLTNALRTGFACTYRPEQPVAWRL